MEVNGPSEWRFLANQHLIAASSRSVRKVLGSLINSLGKKMKGMPSFSATATLPSSPAFRTTVSAKTPSLARIEGWLARFPMFDGWECPSVTEPGLFGGRATREQMRRERMKIKLFVHFAGLGKLNQIDK
ncbi:hypothetical protein K1719_005167 [Acacia pycnantha]|nr:hypothetical protein K1719_005167 [Acacia pycnantha]